MKNKKIYLIFMIFTLFVSLFAKTQNSTQGHDGKVTAIAVAMSEGKQVVYTGSEDGFLIRWNEDGTGEHFQISDDRIEMIAVHPNGNDIAVYETDGLTLNRLSVWNWSTLTKKFASKRLSSTITSLSYSERGTQIMIGQANIMGIIFIDSIKGTLLSNKIKETAGTVTLSLTSRSENTSIMYSALGYLIYTNLRSGQRTASFKVESGLENPVLFYNNVLFAGIKGNYIYIYDATSGNLVAKIKANKPIMSTSKTDQALYYFETDGKNSNLKMIEIVDGLINTEPVTVNKFTFSFWDNPTTAVKSGSSIYIGMESGELYTLDANPQVDTITAHKVTTKVYDKIYDINELEGEFYFLSEDTILKSSYHDKSITSIANNSGYTNMITTKEAVYLWSKKTKQPVKKVDLLNNTETILFTPSSSLETLKIQGDKLVYIEGSKNVGYYDFTTKKTTNIFTGTGIQDALLIDNEMYVAKTAAGNPKAPLVKVHLTTKETIPINIKGEVSFSLAENESPNGPFYGTSIVSENDTTTTKVFSYNPKTKGYSIILSLADEDTKSFTYLHDGTLYTNIGRTQIYSVALSQKKLTKMQQSASLPMKMVSNDDTIAVLNKDGSITWFNATTKQMLKDWYITVNGEWIES